MNRSILSAAALIAASMAGMGQSVEVIPRSAGHLPDAPRGLGGWLERNNRSRFPRGKRPPQVRAKRLQRATGPGSYDEWKSQLAAVRATKRIAQVSL